MDRVYWTKTERELDPAKGRTALNAAAKKLRAELKRLDAEEPAPSAAGPYAMLRGRAARFTLCPEESRNIGRDGA